MSKFNVSFNVDMVHIVPELFSGNAEPSGDEVRDQITHLILDGARARARTKLQDIRVDSDIDLDVKTVQMSEQLRIIMLTLMTQANLEVTPISQETNIETKLPFEIAYAA